MAKLPSRFRRLDIPAECDSAGRTDQEVYVPLPSLEQREYLRVRTICIARAGDLATCAHVLAGST